MATSPKQPEDHKPKATNVEVEPEEYFTFTIDGTEYTMPNKTLDVITTGFIRKNRKLDEYDYVLTAVEEMAGDGKPGEEILDAIDSMSRKDLPEFLKSFEKHLGASLGE